MNVRANLAIILAFGFTASSAETVTFDKALAGSIPPGWSVSSTDTRRASRWQIRSDKTAPSRPLVFAQVGARSGREDYSVALFDEGTCKDGEVSVSLKLMGGKIEQSAGVIWRFQSSGDYYFAQANSAKSMVGIYKRSGGVVSQVAHASVPHRVEGSEWNLMKVVFRGPRLTLFFGRRKLIDTQDGTLENAGKTGICTKADTVAYFDNFRLDRRN